MLDTLTNYQTPVQILVQGNALVGDLHIPRGARGIVVCACGDQGSRKASQLKVILLALQKAGLATLAVDLLMEEEIRNVEDHADLELVSERLFSVISWIWSDDRVDGLPIGLFGVGAEATAVLKVASRLGSDVKAIVICSAFYDLVQREFHMIKAPTLILVNREDRSLIEGDGPLSQLCCDRKVEVVPGASSTITEVSTAACIASLATTWFRTHLCEASVSLVSNAGGDNTNLR